MSVRLALRLEGAAVAAAAIVLYASEAYAWLAFLLLWLKDPTAFRDTHLHRV